MPDVTMLDRVYHFILQTMIERGHAPHYAEIARALAVPPDEGKRRLHELMTTGLPNFLFPDTDLIAGFGPFSNLPNQYRITVDGQQKWFAEGALEAPAVCWLFPGKNILIEALCLDCGEPMTASVRNGLIEHEEPSGLYGYTDLPFREWRNNWPYAGSRMNLFRSEEHARRWSGFNTEKAEGLLSFADMVAIMSTPRHRERSNGHYVSSVGTYSQPFFARLREVTRNSPFWDPAPH